MCWAGAHLSLASVLKCRLSVVPAVQGAFHIDTLEVTGGFFPNVIVILIMLVWTATANLAMWASGLTVSFLFLEINEGSKENGKG